MTENKLKEQDNEGVNNVTKQDKNGTNSAEKSSEEKESKYFRFVYDLQSSVIVNRLLCYFLRILKCFDTICNVLLFRLTKKFLRQHCKDLKLYTTPYLNDVLYLHYKGIKPFCNLTVFVLEYFEKKTMN